MKQSLVSTILNYLILGSNNLELNTHGSNQLNKKMPLEYVNPQASFVWIQTGFIGEKNEDQVI